MSGPYASWACRRAADYCPRTMTTAQVVFAAALGSIAIGISLFALYVVSSTVWGDRWVRKGSDR